MRRNLSTLQLIIVIAITSFSCNSDQSQKANSPDVLGWMENERDQLKNECLENYQGVSKAGIKVSEESYCDCLVKKITISLSRDKYLHPSEQVVQQIEEYSKACEALTKVEVE